MSTELTAEIERLDIGDGVRSIVWQTGPGVEFEGLEGRIQTPRILVELDIDGSLDYVSAELVHFDDLTVMNRALDVLTTARDRLTAIYGDQPRRVGSCPAQGEYGNCNLTLNHGDTHDFPVPKHAAEGRAAEDLKLLKTQPWAGSWHR